jgi:hypothetical protein
MGKPEGKILLGRPKLRLVDNIRMNVREIGWEGMNWIGLAQGRNNRRDFLNVIMNFQFPKNAGKFLSIFTNCGLRRRAQLHGDSLPSYGSRSFSSMCSRVCQRSVN